MDLMETQLLDLKDFVQFLELLQAFDILRTLLR